MVGVVDGAAVGSAAGVGDAVGTKRVFGLGSAATADALCWGLGWRVFTTDRLCGATAFASTIDSRARMGSRSLIRVFGYRSAEANSSILSYMRNAHINLKWHSDWG